MKRFQVPAGYELEPHPSALYVAGGEYGETNPGSPPDSTNVYFATFKSDPSLPVFPISKGVRFAPAMPLIANVSSIRTNLSSVVGGISLMNKSNPYVVATSTSILLMEVTSLRVKFLFTRTPTVTELFTVITYSHSTQRLGAALGSKDGSALKVGDSLGSKDKDGFGVFVGSSEGTALGEAEGDHDGERLGMLEGEELGDAEGESTQIPQ
jgi:hypothetical protein